MSHLFHSSDPLSLPTGSSNGNSTAGGSTVAHQPSPEPPPVCANRLLASLPTTEYERLAPHLKPVTLNQGDTLYGEGDTIEHVYFPTKCMISLVTELADGFGVEVCMVGKEGMAGIDIILGVNYSKQTATVQIPGQALKLSAHVLREEFERGGQLRYRLLRYTHALMSMISQSAACNRRHDIGGRLARWLLTAQDRVERDELPLTHEFMGNMLGTRRAGVSVAVNELKQAGLVQYTRGNITITDQEGLKALACECYSIVAEEYKRLYD